MDIKMAAICCAPILILLSACSEFGSNEKSYGLYQISFSPTGKWLVAGGGFLGRNKRPWGGDGIVKVWNAQEWKSVASFGEGFTDPVEAIFFMTDDSFAVTSRKVNRESRGAPGDGTWLRSWNILEKKELPKAHLRDSLARGIGYFPPEKKIALATSISSLPDFRDTVLLEKHRIGIGSHYMRFSPDGKRILSCTNSRDDPPSLRVHETSNGKRIAESKLDGTTPWCAQFSPNGKMIAVATQPISSEFNDGKIFVVDAESGANLLRLDSWLRTNFVTFTPDNKMIAVIQGRNSIQLFSLKTKQPATAFDKNPEGVNCCCFSPDGALIAIGCGGQPQDSGQSPGRVRVFDVKTGKLVAQLD